jgi:hypothetical protein
LKPSAVSQRRSETSAPPRTSSSSTTLGSSFPLAARPIFRDGKRRHAKTNPSRRLIGEYGGVGVVRGELWGVVCCGGGKSVNRFETDLHQLLLPSIPLLPPILPRPSLNSSPKCSVSLKCRAQVRPERRGREGRIYAWGGECRGRWDALRFG